MRTLSVSCLWAQARHNETMNCFNLAGYRWDPRFRHENFIAIPRLHPRPTKVWLEQLPTSGRNRARVGTHFVSLYTNTSGRAVEPAKPAKSARRGFPNLRVMCLLMQSAAHLNINFSFVVLAFVQICAFLVVSMLLWFRFLLYNSINLKCIRVEAVHY